jgi:two-component system chemotaxis response regulator CheB
VSRDLVVVGASAGGVEALRVLARGLPANLPASVVVVLHVPPTGTSVLPGILERSGPLPARHAVDGETLEPCRIYVAPPDSHVPVHDGALRLERGPRENGHRPAIDPLFRTAARSFGDRVVGVILSGSLDDGTLGLAAIKANGGVTVAQDPDDALYPSMPRNAIARAGADYVVTAGDLAGLVVRLVGGPTGDNDGERGGEGASVESDPTTAGPERITGENEARGDVSGYTCPECNGTLWEVRQDGGLRVLRCRVGHAYSEEAYAQAKWEALEAALWTALQTLEEKADFCRRLAARFTAEGHEQTARRYVAQRENALRQAARIREAIADLDVTVPSAEGELRAS